MSAPSLFEMNSSSSQSLDMLQSIEVGSIFIFFLQLFQGYPSKKIYLTT
jgi:hypothetical protein